jgi:hypothetical protein
MRTVDTSLQWKSWYFPPGRRFLINTTPLGVGRTGSIEARHYEETKKATAMFADPLRIGGLGFGLVFELTPTAGGRWMEKVLHGFGPENYYQQQPYSGLIFDASGNLYGTTLYGGARGGGTV